MLKQFPTPRPRNTAGSTWEFVLNQAADNVTVLRNGGNALNLGALAAGRHTFDLGAFSSFDIQVSKSAPADWTLISDPTNLFTNFNIPSGLAINTNPASQYFGTVYVNNANTTPTQRGRQMGDGVYALTADMKGVDLTNFAAVADPNDTTQAKAPGWTVNLQGSVSAWRLALDGAGNVLAADWSDQSGGIKYASPNLATGGLVLAGEGGEPGLSEVHGSTNGKPVILSGSVGNNLVLAAMDEDLSPFNSIWKWNVGNATAYDQPPETVIDSNSLSALGGTWIPTVNGVRAGNHYSPQHDLWYLVQNRNNGSEAGIFVVKPDNTDGFSPTLLWNSLSFSQDPNGDLDPADALDGNTSLDDVQDVFRNIGDVTLSPDGTKLYVHRIGSNADNPFQGGAVSIIPLDANGVPAIQVSGGQMTNVTTIATIGDNLPHSSGAQLEFDAAGNLYVANSGILTLANFNGDSIVDGDDFLVWQQNNGSPGDATMGDANGDGTVDDADLAIWNTQFGATGGQLVQVFSPGGNTKAVTSSSGMFRIDPLATGSASGVPEPGSLLLALLLAPAARIRNRRRARAA